MKPIIYELLLIFVSMQTFIQNSHTEQEIIKLSKNKWQWMADKDVDKLKDLFDDKSVFVHMGGSWGKDRELEVIGSGGIHYRKADIHEVSVQIIGNTAILLNRITLLAVAGGNEVTKSVHCNGSVCQRKRQVANGVTFVYQNADTTLKYSQSG